MIQKWCEGKCGTKLTWIYNGGNGKGFFSNGDGSKHFCESFDADAYHERNRNEHAEVITEKFRMHIRAPDIEEPHEQTVDTILRRLMKIENMVQELTLKVTSILPVDVRQR